MGRIEDNRGATPLEVLEPRRPVRRRQPARLASVESGKPRLLDGLEQAHRDRGVVDLMVPGERECTPATRAPPIGTRGLAPAVVVTSTRTRLGADQDRAAGRAGSAIDRVGFRWQRSADDRYAGLDDAGLLDGDRGEVVAQLRLVVEIDRGDRRGNRRDDVRGVEAAAQSDLQDRESTWRRNSSKAIAVAHSKKVGGRSASRSRPAGGGADDAGRASRSPARPPARR